LNDENTIPTAAGFVRQDCACIGAILFCFVIATPASSGVAIQLDSDGLLRRDRSLQ
jgi:hypothetical protein